MKISVYAAVILSVMVNLAFAETCVNTKAEVKESGAAEERMVGSLPAPAPETGVGEEARDEERVDSDS